MRIEFLAGCERGLIREYLTLFYLVNYILWTKFRQGNEQTNTSAVNLFQGYVLPSKEEEETAEKLTL